MNDDPITGQLPDHIRATRRGRIAIAACIGLAVVSVALFQIHAIPFIKAALGTTPHAIAMIKGIFGSLAALSTLAGSAAFWHGRKIMRRGQYPLPGAWVWRDTAVKRGIAAIRYGWAYMISGVLTGMLCIGLMLYASSVLDQLVSQHKVREGVTILQEKIIRAPSQP